MKKPNILVFGGTTEGREISVFFEAHGFAYRLCVATEYGKAVNKDYGAVSGRLQQNEIFNLIRLEGYDMVVDATHPYALHISENIRGACLDAGCELIRITRSHGQAAGKAFQSHREAAEYLNKMASQKHILLTVGSKELEAYTLVKGFNNRVFVRILPMVSSLQYALDLGYDNACILCMQGPFSKEMNMACLQMTGAQYLVTKDSGPAGGFSEKLAAAEELGVEILVIGRKEEPGVSLAEFKDRMTAQFALRENVPRFPVFLDLRDKKIVVIGGGKIAERRIETLFRFSPAITVIAPEITDTLRHHAAKGAIHWIQKAYGYGDLEGCFLAVAATDKRSVNRKIYEEALENNIFISVADNRAESTFWFPAIAGNETIVTGIVSSNGDHGLVKKTAAQIRKLLGDGI